MEQEDVYKCVLREPSQITKNEFAGITLKIAHMDGEMTTTIVVLIYVQDQTPGIPMAIMWRTYVQSDAVKVLGRIITQEQEYA